MNTPNFCGRGSSIVILSVAIVCASMVSASAQQLAKSDSVTFADRSFVTTLLRQSRKQLALAQLAVKRATAPITASAAKETVTEWRSLHERLLAIAIAERAPIRGALDADQRADLAQLGRTPPARFDIAYLRDAQRGNRKALAAMRAQEGTTDPALHRFVETTRPLVESYEQMTADDLAQHLRQTAN